MKGIVLAAGVASAIFGTPALADICFSNGTGIAANDLTLVFAELRLKKTLTSKLWGDATFDGSDTYTFSGNTYVGSPGCLRLTGVNLADFLTDGVIGIIDTENSYWTQHGIGQNGQPYDKNIGRLTSNDVTNAPEPGMWLLMGLGFGLTGSVIRYRHRPTGALLA